jgi:hypothetical protein
MELRRESSANLYEKIIGRLLGIIRPLAPGYGLVRILYMTESDDDDDEGANTPLAVLYEHFSDVPMLDFSSESPSFMPLLRRLCVQDGQFAFAFGFEPHAFHNLCMYL